MTMTMIGLYIALGLLAISFGLMLGVVAMALAHASEINDVAEIDTTRIK